MESIDKIIMSELTQSYFGIQVYQYLLALIFIAAGFIGRRLSINLIKKLDKAAAGTHFAYDDVLVDIIRKPLPLACVLVGIYLAINALPVPTTPIDVRRFLYANFKSATVLLVIWVAVRLVDGVCQQWLKSAQRKGSGVDTQLIPILNKTGKAFLIVVGGILFLQNLGYSVSSLLAGFGLGGMAFALASKDSLANLFGSIVIFMDRPFRVGDWVEMDGWEGTIEEIGLRTTRVRTFSNSLLTVPNMKFTTSVINNWQRMHKRRITFRLGVSYDTSPEKIKKLVERIRELIKTNKDFNQDYYLVNFDTFGASSLDIFIYSFTNTTVWKDFLEVKQAFFLDILNECQKMSIDIAFPTQTVLMGGPVKVENAPPADGQALV